MISSQKIRGARGGLSGGMRNRILGPLVLAVCLLALPQGAWATTATWSAATNFDYNTLTNWAGAPPSIPGTNPAETAAFTDSGSGNVGIGAATANPVGFTFSNTKGNNYNITVDTNVHQGLTGVTTTGTGTVMLEGSTPGTYTLTGPCTFNMVDGDQTTTVTGVITNGISAGQLIKIGSGTLNLDGANTYSGGTTLKGGGTLGIGVDSVVVNGVITSGALGTGTLKVESGGTLIAPFPFPGTPHTLANNIDITNASLAVNSVADLTLNGVISGAGSLIEYIC